ncbi:hypothetical protein SCHPADRAFT_716869 [Schizopora paradoxa]|uniref:F-box domain-containing protein n=1 Tax=Schizopora paradoxa TaxID=27342 RepID=A0A0H2RLG6_9AGAM|nr:hypothetical protein SCHPADRAFT_716869 [Schizopora paradoxa]
MDRAKQPRIPQLVVELVLEDIGKEMMKIALESFHPRGGEISTFSLHRPHLSLIHTLFDCSLVHSSWLLQIIQNPCLGQWTRCLNLSFSYMDVHPDFIAALFDRIPNITFLALNLSDCDVSEDALCMISEHISRRFHRLEELVLSLPRPDVDQDDDTQREFFVKFLAFPSSIPSLKSLRLSGYFVEATIEPPFLQESGVLAVAPNLTHFQVDTAITRFDEVLREASLISLSWVKEMTASGVHFVPDCMHHWVETLPSGSNNLDTHWLVAITEAYPMIRFLRLVYNSKEESGFEGGLRSLASFVQSFTSITTLELSLPNSASPHCDAALKALHSMSATVETVHIFFQFFWPKFPRNIINIYTGQHDTYYEPYARFERMDELLADALISQEEKNSQLHTLVLHCEITDFAWEDRKVDAFRFPRTTAWCKQRNLYFEKRAAIKWSYDEFETTRFRVE